jgi:hypothetical protein
MKVGAAMKRMITAFWTAKSDYRSKIKLILSEKQN